MMSRIQTVRLCVENAVVVPPMPEPLAPNTPPVSDESKLPRHLGRRFCEALPIACAGIAFATAGEGSNACGSELIYLYRDINGLPRSFAADGHDRIGIGSLFDGNVWLLARLWPAPPRARLPSSTNPARRSEGWCPDDAAASLLCHQGRVGTVRGDGFAPIAEPAVVHQAHIAIGRLARRLLWRRVDPYEVLDLARGWNATRGQAALSDVAVEQIVDAACLRQLRTEDERRAG